MIFPDMGMAGLAKSSRDAAPGIPRMRKDAASAIAAIAKGTSVRILPVRARRSEGPVYNFPATPWL